MFLFVNFDKKVYKNLKLNLLKDENINKYFQRFLVKGRYQIFFVIYFIGEIFKFDRIGIKKV